MSSNQSLTVQPIASRFPNAIFIVLRQALRISFVAFANENMEQLQNLQNNSQKCTAKIVREPIWPPQQNVGDQKPGISTDQNMGQRGGVVGQRRKPVPRSTQPEKWGPSVATTGSGSTSCIKYNKLRPNPNSVANSAQSRNQPTEDTGIAISELNDYIGECDINGLAYIPAPGISNVELQKKLCRILKRRLTSWSEIRKRKRKNQSP